MNANTVPRVRIPLSPPQTKNPPNRWVLLFVLCLWEDSNPKERGPFGASSATARGARGREHEKGGEKEYRVRTLVRARDDYFDEWGIPLSAPKALLS